MKKIIAVLSFFLLFGVFPATTFAQAGPPPQNFEKRMMNPASSGSANKQMMMQKNGGNLQERAQKELTRRISSLKNAITRINKIKRLSAEQKTSLIAQIQTQIDSLTALQAKIEADTDPQTLQADVQSIVKDYRIYLLFMPKIVLLTAADAALNVADQESSLAAKLQTRLTEAQSAGQDITTLQTSLTDMNTQITAARTLAQTVMTTVIQLTPEGYPANKVTLQNARTQLKTVYQDLRAGRDDATTIIKGLQLEKTDVSASSSPSASCAPRPACLDGNPKCLLAEPSGGWCPTTSVTP